MLHCVIYTICTYFQTEKFILFFKIKNSYTTFSLFLCYNHTFYVHTVITESQEVEDAQKIRRNVMDCFERASLPYLDEEERKKNLHFVVVGGGPTGVEFAAELHDFVTEDLSKLYPSIQHLVKISLIEAADHILTM